MSVLQSGLQIITGVNASAPRQRGKRRQQDLIYPALDMIAEILTMRERGATNAILSLVLVFSGIFKGFLNRSAVRDSR